MFEYKSMRPLSAAFLFLLSSGVYSSGVSIDLSERVLIDEVVYEITGDEDGDYLPDDWESANGLDPTILDAHHDLDGDGFSNLSEYILETNPNDDQSHRELAPYHVFELDGDLLSLPDDVLSTRTTVDAWSVNELDGERVLHASRLTRVNLSLLWAPSVAGDIYFDIKAPYEFQISFNGFSGQLENKGEVIEGWQRFKYKIPSFGSPMISVLEIINQNPRVDIEEDIYIKNLFAVNRESDTDGDLMPDHFELYYGLDPNSNSEGAQDAEEDVDGDGLTNLAEFELGTSPIKADTDGDGYSDSEDVFPTNPEFHADFDGDGKADAVDSDIDGDGIVNILEDLYPHILSSYNPEDASDDPDGDGLTNLEEFDTNTLPDVWDTDGDGYNDSEDAFPLDQAYHADLDGDGKADAIDPDIDGDGLPNSYENQYDFLSERDASDSALDNDSDGVSNKQEYSAGTDPTQDDYAPVIARSKLSTRRVDSTGVLTAIESLGKASAVDGADNASVDVIQTNYKSNNFPPGVHTVIWESTDEFGNKAVHEQKVHVKPRVEFPRAKQLITEDAFDLCIQLNGEAFSYPVAVDLLISEVKDELDNPSDGLTQPGAGLTQPIITIEPEGETAEDTLEHQEEVEEDVVVQVVFSDSELVACSSVNASEIGLVEGTNVEVSFKAVENAAENAVARLALEWVADPELLVPQVVLKASQSGVQTRKFIDDQGIIEVEVQLEVLGQPIDLTENTDYEINWSETTDFVINTNAAGNILRINPTSVSEGVYPIIVGVYKKGDLTQLPVKRSMQIDILNNSNGNGLIADADFDGVPDVYEGETPLTNLVINSEGHTKVLTELGLSVYLDIDDSVVDDEELIFGDDAVASLEAYEKKHGIVNEDSRGVEQVLSFEIGGLAKPGDQVSVVIQLDEPMKNRSTYYKIKRNKWVEFSTENGDFYSSARSVNGICPGVDSPSYISLNKRARKDDDCLLLKITDGGPNDDDGLVDGYIKDPGGLGTFTLDETEVGDGGRPIPSKKEAGSIGIIMLLSLIMLARFKRLRVK
ncbi:choice-of-anchor U domain-containing protein [Litoribacillus peritrichatus]|uniref:Uncharacterized protein n=1 Tax=Litoribacillus peritrichatus TaxID=718191 RepID=A0ABP7M2J5_9GAMM